MIAEHGPEWWEGRYAAGHTSGAGSEGDAARAKAGYVNRILARPWCATVLDLGCGDGTVAKLLDLDAVDYLGVDPAPTAIARCLAVGLGARGSFMARRPSAGHPLSADVVLSLDVVFHLVDDDEWADHWRTLFGAARRAVCVHGTDYDAPAHGHMRHRRISPLAPPGWVLADQPADPTVPGFYLWRHAASGT